MIISSKMHIFRAKVTKNLADRRTMITFEDPHQQSLEDFILPFGGKLDGRNRWIRLAEVMPWEVLSEVYHRSLSPKMGRSALPARIVVGALIIKHMLKLTDEETIEQIRENPYLQYFLGYSSYSYDNRFEPSLFVSIRKRLGERAINELNEIFIDHTKKERKAGKSKTKKKNKDDDQQGSSYGEDNKGKTGPSKENQGILLLDATVAPADIKYPTDLDLLNKVREHSEDLIDKLYDPEPGKVKPRTYRRKARKSYLSLSKKRKKGKKAIRKGIKAQLGYISRNFKTIKRMLEEKDKKIFPLSNKDQRLYWIIQEVYRQQKEMYDKKCHRIQHRIVSISQPHVRPIIRGKAGANVEFGAKLSASVVDSNIYLDRIGWDAFNESLDLPSQVENYRRRFGFYPSVVITDNIYGSRENRNYLKVRGIRYSGTPLGRPKKNLSDTENEALKKQRKKEAIERILIEGKFGVGKRKYSLDLVLAKLKDTSESWIAMVVFVMNIADWLRNNFLFFFRNWLNNKFFAFKNTTTRFFYIKMGLSFNSCL